MDNTSSCDIGGSGGTGSSGPGKPRKPCQGSGSGKPTVLERGLVSKGDKESTKLPSHYQTFLKKEAELLKSNSSDPKEVELLKSIQYNIAKYKYQSEYGVIIVRSGDTQAIEKEVAKHMSTIADRVKTSGKEADALTGLITMTGKYPGASVEMVPNFYADTTKDK